MTATLNWRNHDTPEARAAFGDAQYRLDNVDFGEDGYTPEQATFNRDYPDLPNNRKAKP